jgi:hypothetical protein
MPIKSSGTLSFSDIRNEAGPTGTSSVSLSSYRGAMAGIPLSGPIEMSDFYGKTFLVTEIITENTVWSPKINFARFIHIFVVGAGGSGGHGWPNDDTFVNGNAGASGGGAGGVSYSKILTSSADSYIITIGTGGLGVAVTGEERATDGIAGTLTSFVGGSLNMIGNGGGAGQASQKNTGGSDSISGVGGIGGTATGGNIANYTGGSGGAYACSGTGENRTASGGGAVRFANSQNGTASNSTTNSTTQGAKVSSYTDFPSILTTYITGRSQTPVLSSSITDFDASNGTKISGGTASPKYGSGSGGSGASSSSKTGDGGDGIVIIVYEI